MWFDRYSCNSSRTGDSDSENDMLVTHMSHTHIVSRYRTDGVFGPEENEIATPKHAEIELMMAACIARTTRPIPLAGSSVKETLTPSVMRSLVLAVDCVFRPFVTRSARNSPVPPRNQLCPS